MPKEDGVATKVTLMRNEWSPFVLTDSAGGRGLVNSNTTTPTRATQSTLLHTDSTSYQEMHTPRAYEVLTILKITKYKIICFGQKI